MSSGRRPNVAVHRHSLPPGARIVLFRCVELTKTKNRYDTARCWFCFLRVTTDVAVKTRGKRPSATFEAHTLGWLRAARDVLALRRAPFEAIAWLERARTRGDISAILVHPQGVQIVVAKTPSMGHGCRK